MRVLLLLAALAFLGCSHRFDEQTGHLRRRPRYRPDDLFLIHHAKNPPDWHIEPTSLLDIQMVHEAWQGGVLAALQFIEASFPEEDEILSWVRDYRSRYLATNLPLIVATLDDFKSLMQPTDALFEFYRPSSGRGGHMILTENGTIRENEEASIYEELERLGHDSGRTDPAARRVALRRRPRYRPDDLFLLHHVSDPGAWEIIPASLSSRRTQDNLFVNGVLNALDSLAAAFAANQQVVSWVGDVRQEYIASDTMTVYRAFEDLESQLRAGDSLFHFRKNAWFGYLILAEDGRLWHMLHGTGPRPAPGTKSGAEPRRPSGGEISEDVVLSHDPEALDFRTLVETGDRVFYSELLGSGVFEIVRQGQPRWILTGDAVTRTDHADIKPESLRGRVELDVDSLDFRTLVEPGDVLECYRRDDESQYHIFKSDGGVLSVVVYSVKESGQAQGERKRSPPD